jgi:integrase
MPLALKPPRKGKSPYWSVRGTYLGIGVDRSTKARKRALAVKILQGIERQIERGEFAQAGEATFAGAAAAYMKAGGERRFLTPLIRHFGMTPLRRINQAAVDAAAATLLPQGSAATRNRQVYTPLQAVLRRAGARLDLARPLGSGGRKLAGWLWPEQAFALIAEAAKLNAEFGLLCTTLLFTGERLSEALALEIDRLRLAEAFAYLPDSKNEDPRAIFLPPYLVAELANHPRGLDRPGERIFRFAKGGHLYALLRAAAARAGVDLPERQAFHIFCHTWATWMRRYAGLDTKGLMATGRWRDRKSVDVYEHVVVSEEAGRAVLLPTPSAKRA